MDNVDPSDASRSLREAHTMERQAATAQVYKRSRWAVYGAVVFAASVLFWLVSPDPEWMNPLMMVLALAAALLARSPRWGALTGQRARLTGTAGRKVRTLTLATVLGVLVLCVLLNNAGQLVMEEPSPIAGALVGLLLALAGPPFARWWMSERESRG